VVALGALILPGDEQASAKARAASASAKIGLTLVL
jgi:hypothetical protein